MCIRVVLLFRIKSRFFELFQKRYWLFVWCLLYCNHRRTKSFNERHRDRRDPGTRNPGFHGTVTSWKPKCRFFPGTAVYGGLSQWAVEKLPKILIRTSTRLTAWRTRQWADETPSQRHPKTTQTMRITPMGWIWKIIRKSYTEVPNPETQAVSRLWRVSQRTRLIELLPHVPIASALRKMDKGDKQGREHTKSVRTSAHRHGGLRQRTLKTQRKALHINGMFIHTKNTED